MDPCLPGTSARQKICDRIASRNGNVFLEVNSKAQTTIPSTFKEYIKNTYQLTATTTKNPVTKWAKGLNVSPKMRYK